MNANVPIETVFPDINEWAIGNTRFNHVWTYKAATPGPHVCVSALVHGNEVCGAIAADWLLRELARGLRPVRGTLSVVSGKLAKRSPDAMTVRTPSTILGVRGTEFVVRAGE